MKLAGLVGYEDTEKLKLKMIGLIDQGKVYIVLDVSGVDQLISSTLGVLFATLKELKTKNGKIAIMGPNPNLRKTLRDWKMDQFIPVFETMEEAAGVSATLNLSGTLLRSMRRVLFIETSRYLITLFEQSVGLWNDSAARGTYEITQIESLDTPGLAADSAWFGTDIIRYILRRRIAVAGSKCAFEGEKKISLGAPGGMDR